MRNEALKRLNILEEKGLWDNVKKQFIAGKICVSEAVPVNGWEALGVKKNNAGIVFDLDTRPELKKEVEEFEKQYKCLVYHCILDAARMLCLLYVSEDYEEWEYDLKDLEAGYPLVYVKNKPLGINEFGSIQIEVSGGGLIRIG